MLPSLDSDYLEMLEQNFRANADEDDAADDEETGTEFRTETRSKPVGKKTACKRRDADDGARRPNRLIGTVEAKSNGACVDARGERRQEKRQS